MRIKTTEHTKQAEMQKKTCNIDDSPQRTQRSTE
jgi:hypothetical protein